MVTVTATAIEETADPIIATASTVTITAGIADTTYTTMTQTASPSTTIVSTRYQEGEPTTEFSTTETVTDPAVTVTASPSVTTTTSTSYVTTTSQPPKNEKRDDAQEAITVRPSRIPSYASACVNTLRYGSACSCWGIKEVC